MVLRFVAVFGLLYVFLIGVQGLGDGFNLLGRDTVEAFFRATENPFMGLMVGILATTLVQSSSVSTSMIVALVAAPDNPLPVANAVPMIMGANIGTTVTNTVVALAHMGRPEEFRRAFAVATCHDFFNYMAVAILLPLEMATGVLRRAAGVLAAAVGDVGGRSMDSPIKDAIKAGYQPIKDLSQFLFDAKGGQAALIVLVSAVLIFSALLLLVRVMRSAMRTRVELYINRLLGSSVLVSIAVGIILTVMVQSSSITTSLLVPLAGAGLITLAQAFPVTIGANIGTTITALLAWLGATGANASAGLQIALVHLLFNVTATLIIFPVDKIRSIPLRAAQRLADLAVRSRKWALIYVAGLFYLLPALLALLDSVLSR